MRYDPRELLNIITGLADCRRRQVGAVILDEEGYLVGWGANKLPVGSCTRGECPRGQLTYEEQPAFQNYENNCVAIHAEQGAIRMARGKGVKLYVSCEPCPMCAAEIAATDLVVEVLDLKEASNADTASD